MLTIYRCPSCFFWVKADAGVVATDGTPLCPHHLKDLRAGTEVAPTLRGERKSAKAGAPRFLPDIISASCDVERLATQMVGADVVPGPRLLLYGPPGTGKSLYARHLAERMGLTTSAVSYGELASRYVGETEKAIRKAFDAAAARREFLILDEADSLLRSRALSSQSWERNQVNELLQAFDRLSTPIALTTNDMSELDPAVMRRIDFKIGFNAYSTVAQVVRAFRHFLDRPLPPVCADLAELALTPGDFQVVRRRAAFVESDDAGLTEALRHEASFKSDAPSRSIGFEIVGVAH